MYKLNSVVILFLTLFVIKSFADVGSPFELDYPSCCRQYDPMGHISDLTVRAVSDAEYLGTVTIIDDYNENGVYSGTWGTSYCYSVVCFIPSRSEGGQEILATLLIAKANGKFVQGIFNIVGTDKVLRTVTLK